MLKNQVTKKFITSLILSDFIFLEKKNILKNQKNIDLILKLKTNTLILNYFHLIRDLKQFLRLLFFLKRFKQHKLYLYIKSKFYIKFLTGFIADKNLKHLEVLTNFASKNFNKNISCNMLLILNSFDFNFKNLIHQLFLNKIYLIQNINSNIELTNSGTYKMFNEINDFKKMLFILILITQSL